MVVGVVLFLSLLSSLFLISRILFGTASKFGSEVIPFNWVNLWYFTTTYPSFIGFGKTEPFTLEGQIKTKEFDCNYCT